jgi:hypothetical protein
MAKKGEIVPIAKPKSSRKTPGKTKAGSKATGVNGREKRELIGKSAYFRAERRGFVPGFEMEDWLAAENEIEGLLQTESPKSPSKKA